MVLDLLLKAGVSINFDKSSFATEKVNYLGHVITSEGIKPEISKVESFKLKPIKTKKHLERLLGFINCFRPFIPNLSIKTAILYDKLKKNKIIIKLTDEDKKIIDEIFKIIKEQPILHLPDFNIPFEIFCDSSDNGVGSILLQNAKLIGYFSKKNIQRPKITTQ
ncbi:Retrovirus-related Pol polyprotein from transposon 17.6 [Dictyocoela muelleri]|nr:Retrovirus-related Pol polyprotein from transposon 17.6 [Dictyocoela muelleri]